MLGTQAGSSEAGTAAGIRLIDAPDGRETITLACDGPGNFQIDIVAGKRFGKAVSSLIEQDDVGACGE
jgi:hypothetical protein